MNDWELPRDSEENEKNEMEYSHSYESEDSKD